ncbi:hypothetical protein D3C83_314060 [compost metagenome]
MRGEIDLGRECVRHAGAVRADVAQVAAGKKQPRGGGGRERREEDNAESGHLCQEFRRLM